jgi:hypothetical protein
MMKVLGLKDFGSWLKKDEKVVIGNNIGIHVIKRGYAKFITYVDNKDKRSTNSEEIKRRNQLIKDFQKKYNMKLKDTYSLHQVLSLLEKAEKMTEQEVTIKLIGNINK